MPRVIERRRKDLLEATGYRIICTMPESPSAQHAPKPSAGLGILMLDTTFDRPDGDAGNPASWPFQVQIERVPGALARPVVSGEFVAVGEFIAAGNRLIENGVTAIITTCGFLVRHQKELAAALSVPVETSTLMHYLELQRNVGVGQRVAILTIDASALDAGVRAAAGIEREALVFSLARCAHFASAILDATVPLDLQRAEAEWVELAVGVQQRHPDIGMWLFECANMPPYADAVRRATGLPVFDALTMGRNLHARTC